MVRGKNRLTLINQLESVRAEIKSIESTIDTYRFIPNSENDIKEYADMKDDLTKIENSILEELKSRFGIEM